MRYTRNVFGRTGPAARTVTEAVDNDGLLKGQIFAQDSYITGRGSKYPTHPSMRPALRAAMDGGYNPPDAHPTRSHSSGAMDGVRGPLADGDYRMESYDDEWAQNNSNPGETVPLFTHASNRVPAKVDYMRTTEGSRALAGPLLGIAGREAMNRGEALTPSEDLSRHSAPMVDKMNKSLGTQFSSKQTNDLDFARGMHDSPVVSLGQPDPEASVISDDEVRKGRANFRNTLKAMRPVRDAGYSQMGIFDAPE
jgi:hypothetical protein